jgi:hypothetical protein
MENVTGETIAWLKVCLCLSVVAAESCEAVEEVGFSDEEIDDSAVRIAVGVIGVFKGLTLLMNSGEGGAEFGEGGLVHCASSGKMVMVSVP